MLRYNEITVTVPTKLILLRILLIPIFLALYFCDWEFGRVSALVVFAIASISDLFDGVLARARGQMTDFIKVMDPLADKLLICSALIALLSLHEVAAWFVILTVCRDFAITALRLFAAGQNKIAGAVISGKAGTACQMFLVIVILADMPIAATVLLWTAAALIIISAAENFIREWEVVKRII